MGGPVWACCAPPSALALASQGNRAACKVRPRCAAWGGSPLGEPSGGGTSRGAHGHTQSLGKLPLTIKCQAAQLSTTGSSRLADSIRGIHKQAWMEEGWLTRHLPAIPRGASGHPTCFPGGGREVGQEPAPGRQRKKGPQSSVLLGDPRACQPRPHPWRPPCPLSTLLLQLMPSQSVDRPGLRGHLLLLGLLKA